MNRPGRSWRLALPMYNVTPALGLAWEALLHAVTDGLRQRGWADPMDAVSPSDALMDFWRAPDLLLSQTCGYPLVTELQSDVRVLAVPEFELPGCEGPNYCSAILVPQDGARSLEDLRGAVAVINQAHSHSGMNALRHTIAPLARDGHFFSAVVVSGGHMASMALLQRGQAAVAAVDCATFELAARHAPDAVAGLRILQYSQAAPGLPLIASRELSDAQAQDLLDTLLGLPENAPSILRTLSIRRFRQIRFADYRPITDQACFASERGYSELR